jgi:hypothetical protein
MGPIELKYAVSGHPSIEELIAAQGTTPILDAREELFGKAWPEDESIDDFLSALREWRRPDRTDRAA